MRRSRRGTILQAPARPASPSAGCVALAGTELEFIVFDDTYEEACDRALPRPDAGQPVQRRLLDPRHHAGSSRCCATSATTCTPPGWTSRAPRASATSASTRSRFLLRRGADAPPTTTPSTRPAAKEIAAQHGKALTFMAKYDEREGNSCHIHLSLRGADGELGVLGRRSRRARRCYDQLRRRRAGHDARVHPALRAEHQLLQAVRRRLVRADRGRLGPRQPHLRGARWSGTAPALRMENRVPGGDVNPYLALAAMLAGGLHGIEHELELEAELRGQRLRRPTSRRCRTRCATARDAVRRAPRSPGRPSATRSSTTTSNMADVELAAFDAAVTDWELRRGFERM